MRAHPARQTFRWWLFPLLAAGALCIAEPALAFRCGNKIVSEGDNISKIRHYCGEPVSVQQRVIYRSGITRPRFRYDDIPGNLVYEREVINYDHSYVEVQVEEWTYNFGPRRLMQMVRFENGFVAAISSVGYGYAD